MSRLIDADTMIEAINTWPKYGVDERCRIVPWSDGLEPYIHLRDAVMTITGMPTIEERKTGKWIHIRTEEDGNALYECSECHKGEVHVPIVEVKYCWNCGAKMEGEG